MSTVAFAKVQWIWTEEVVANSFVGAVRQFELTSIPRTASITVFAQLKYKLYVNGRFVNAGPAPFRRPLAGYDSYDIRSLLQQGTNTVFILAYYAGVDLKYGKDNPPGILASLKAGRQRLVSDDSWRVYAFDCWDRATPRRNWAIENIEALTFDNQSFAILSILAAEDYGTAPAATGSIRLPASSARIATRPIESDWQFEPRDVPLLRWQSQDTATVSHIFRLSNDIYNYNDTAARLSNERAVLTWDEERYEALRDAPIVRLQRRRGEPGYGVVFDAGRICAGDAFFEIHTDSPATLDLAHSEDFRNDRPNIWRMGSNYYARYNLKPGLNRARFFHFTGFRYLYFVLKDFEGTLEIRRAGVKHCRADLDFADHFACGERGAEAVYRISQRSLKLNTQARTYDCNTREQGTYWGDSVWICDTVGRLTGNYAHLRDLCRQTPNEVAAKALPDSSLFHSAQTLYEYALVPPEAMRRYAVQTGDLESMRPLLDSAQQIIEKFQTRKDDAGWIRLEGWGEDDPDCRGLLFLDHAGNGWHPMTTTGIDRRDINAGIHLYYLQALDAMVALRRMTGESRTATARANAAEAAALRERLREEFIDSVTGLIFDARPDSGPPAGFSQIVNALAIMTGVIESGAARRVLRLVLDIERYPWISQGTPYSYFSLAEATALTGCVAEMLPLFVRAYLPMIEAGATTVWEAFGGENHDSLNHAWGAVLPYLVNRGVAGIQPNGGGLTVAPDLAAFRTFEYRAPLPQGSLSLSWQPAKAGTVDFNLETSPGMEVTLILPHRTLKLSDGKFSGNVVPG